MTLVADPVPLPAGGSRGGRLAQIVWHLTRRRLAAAHRFTLLGAAWPLVRLLVQWGVLAFVFSSLVDLGIRDYPAFLLTGLVSWTLMQTGVAAGTQAIVHGRHLLVQPGVPAMALPGVAVGAAVLDSLVALPVLLVFVAVTGGLGWSVLLLPAVIALQVVLMVGLSLMLSAVTAYLRDVASLVDVGLTLTFYLTPIFYAPDRVPDALRPVVELNPAGAMVELWRAAVMDGGLPPLRAVVVAVVAAAVALVAGLVTFRRLEPGLLDQL